MPAMFAYQPPNCLTFRAAVPFGGQGTQVLSSLPSKRDCSPKRVKSDPLRIMFSVQCPDGDATDHYHKVRPSHAKYHDVV